MYHRVADDDADPWGLAVSVRRFEEQVRWLKRSRSVIPLVELVRRHQRGDLDPTAIAITFDDGYACNATTAAPILAALDLPATVFVTTGPVASGREFWWDDLQRIVSTTEATRLELSTDGRWLVVDLGEPTAQHRAWRADRPPRTRRETAYMSLWRAVRAMDPEAQAASLAELRTQAGVAADARPTHRPMNVDEIRSLGRSGGIDIGAHTVNHPVLTACTRADQRAEVEGGLRMCEAMIGRRPSSFAYPYGDHDAETIAMVRAAGVDVACTTERAPVTAGRDVLALPRVQVEDWSADDLGKVVRGL